MVSIDIEDAVEYEVIHALRTEVGSLSFDVGVVPEFPDGDLEAPTISVEATLGDMRGQQPRTVSRTDDESAGTTELVEKIGEHELSVGLNLWTTSRTKRSEVEPVILGLLLPSRDSSFSALRHGWELTLSKHHGADLRLSLSRGDVSTDDDSESESGIYRRLYRAEGRCDRLTSSELPLAELENKTEINLVK